MILSAGRNSVAELQHQAAAINELREFAEDRQATLVFTAYDEAHNHAIVLRDALLHSWNGSDKEPTQADPKGTAHVRQNVSVPSGMWLAMR
jgi:hypothetical protein